ncbi:ester cyclase [Haladaptatus pallidirubidus]|uniref:ester cyclase n=1 Tax=Haladaptatus pallidirubidus TaxID=1008152 RepID=UPI001D1017BF|nr:ester cyclase [Haladaptatus pallidirubidus]
MTNVFPSRGRSFAINQTHWYRIADGAVTEHDAVRDDLGMTKQLGRFPPQPSYIVRMLLGRPRERRAQRHSERVDATARDKRKSV